MGVGLQKSTLIQRNRVPLTNDHESVQILVASEMNGAKSNIDSDK